MLDAPGGVQALPRSQGTIDVLVVDDHPRVRRSLCEMLRTDPVLRIVGDAGTGRAAIELARRLRPAVVVMDASLPDLSGLEATTMILRSTRGVGVLVVSLHGESYAPCARRAGAKGYVAKDADERDLVDALKRIGRGGSCFPAGHECVLPFVRPMAAGGARVGRGDAA